MKQRKRILKEGPGAGYKLELAFDPYKMISQDLEIRNNTATLDITFKGKIDAKWEGYDWGGEEDDIDSIFTSSVEFNFKDIKVGDDKVTLEFLQETFSNLSLDDDEKFLTYIIEFLGNPDVTIDDALDEFEYFLVKNNVSLADLYVIIENYNKKLSFKFFNTFFDIVVGNSFFYLEYEFIYGGGYSHSDLPEEFSIPIEEQTYFDDMPISHNITNIYIKSSMLADLVNSSYDLRYDDEYDEDEDY